MLCSAGLWLQGCDAVDDEPFELALKDPSTLGDAWQVSEGEVTIRGVGGTNSFNVVAALQRTASYGADEGVHEVYVLQRDEPTKSVIDHRIRHATVFYSHRLTESVVVGHEDPVVYVFSLNTNSRPSMEILEDVGWGGNRKPDIRRFEGYGVAWHNPVDSYALASSAGKASAPSVFEVFAPSDPGLPSASSAITSLRPERCHLNTEHEIDCDSGGVGSTSCSTSGSSGSCSVGCSGSRDACCDQEAVKCQCCHAI